MKKPAGQPIALPSPEHVTGHQLANLLNAAGMVVRVLEGAPSWMGEETPKGGALDGGTKMAAEASLCSILNRIDLIVQDDARWNTDERDTLEKRSLEMLEENIAFLREQTKAAASVNRPSFRFRPALMRVEGGWAAVLGDLSDPASAILGVGANPEEALLAFDAVFAGQTPEQMLAWARKNEKLIDTQYEENMEPGNLEGSPQTPGGGLDRSPDRRKPRKQPKRPKGGDLPGEETGPSSSGAGPGGA